MKRPSRILARRLVVAPVAGELGACRGRRRHNLIHSHRLVISPGVGQLLLCRHRLTGRTDVDVRPYGSDDAWRLLDVDPYELAALGCADTPGELYATSRDLLDRRLA